MSDSIQQKQEDAIIQDAIERAVCAPIVAKTGYHFVNINLIHHFDLFLENPTEYVRGTTQLNETIVYDVVLNLSFSDVGFYKEEHFDDLSLTLANAENEPLFEDAPRNDEAAKAKLGEFVLDLIKERYKESYDEFDWEIYDTFVNRGTDDPHDFFYVHLKSHKTLRFEEEKRLAQITAQAEADKEARIKSEKIEQARNSTKWSIILTVFFLVLVPVAAILLSIESGHLTPEQVLPAEWVEPVKSFFNWK